MDTAKNAQSLKKLQNIFCNSLDYSFWWGLVKVKQKEGLMSASIGGSWIKNLESNRC